MPKLFSIVFLFLICSSIPSGAQTIDPFNGHPADFRVNLQRYFSNAADENKNLVSLSDSVDHYLNGKVWTKHHLTAKLDQYEQLLVSLNRHACWFQLLSYQNKLDTISRRYRQKIGDKIDSLNRFISQHVTQAAFKSLAIDKAYKYHYLLQQSRLNQSHVLDPNTANVVSKLNNGLVERLTTRYDNMMDDITTADLILPDHKKINPVTNRNALLQNPDAMVRGKGMRIYYNAFNEQANLAASILIDIASQKNIVAELTGFKNAPEAIYKRRLQQPEDSVKAMLQRMVSFSNAYTDYQQVQLEHIKRRTGLDTVHSWDLNLSSGYVFKPMAYPDVQQLIHRALSPLGPAYQHSFAWLLNPLSGALDIASGPNRINENTSVGFPGVPTTLYMKSYQGSLSDILRLSHEGGHAVHAQMMSDKPIVPSYSSGPGFLFEAFAILNELLVLDELQKQANTTEAKAFYTKAFLNKLSLEIFISAEEGAFEQNLYDSVAANRVHDRNDIDSLYAHVMKSFDLFFPTEPERKSEWITKRLLFDDPLYNINYLYAVLLSCQLYQEAHLHPMDFQKNYSALLANGFDMPADALIQKFMGFGLGSQSLLHSAVQLMRNQTSMLAALYDQIDSEKK